MKPAKTIQDIRPLSLGNWMPLKDWGKTGRAYPNTDAQWRHLLRHADENGLAQSGAIAKLGRIILVDEWKFVAWIEQHIVKPTDQAPLKRGRRPGQRNRVKAEASHAT